MAFAALAATGAVQAVQFPPKRISKDDFMQVMLGLADGFGLNMVESCIEESKDFGQVVELAIKSFEKKTPEDVKEGLHLLSEAMEDVFPKAAAACGSTAKEVETLVKAISSFATPQTFAYHIGKDLLVNGVQIFEDINKSIGAWKGQQYKAFGSDVGDALKLIIVGKALRDGDEGALIIKGILEGWGTTVEDDCVRDSEDLEKDIQNAIVDMESKTAIGIVKGLYALANALEKALPEATKECKAAQDKIEEIKKALAQFKTIQDFAYHMGKDLKVNGVSIFRDINGALGAWHVKDYETFGKKAGHASWLVAIGNDPTPTNEVDIVV
jgi:hypothetical protein